MLILPIDILAVDIIGVILETGSGTSGVVQLGY